MNKTLRLFQFQVLACCVCVILAVGCWQADPPPVLLPEVEPSAPDVVDPTQRRIPSAGSNARIDWPQLFGPDRKSAVLTHSLPRFWDVAGPPLRWSIEVGTGYGSPVVAAEQVYFLHRIGNEEIVQCVSANSGETVWEHRYPTTFVCEYEYSDGPIGTPVVDRDRLFAVGGQGQFFCLETDTGKVVWERNFHQEFNLEDDLFAVGSSPLVVSDQVFFNVGAKHAGAGIIALDRTTGVTLWQATDHGAGYCMPYHAEIHSQKFLFVVTALGLVCLDPATGKVDWEYEHYSRSPMSFNSVSPLVHEDKVLIVTGPGPGAVCLQVQPDRSYREVWQDRRVLDSQYNTLMLADGLVYGFTAAGQGGAELRCIDFASGKLQWRYASVLRRGQALVIGDAIVAVGERGHLAAISRIDFSPENEPAVLAFTEQPLMSEPSYCSPAFDGRYLYLKDEQRLASFDLTNDRPANGH